SRELELPAGLKRDRPAPGRVEQSDDVAGLHDRLPPKQMLHSFEQGADAAAPLVGNGPVVADAERKFLVLGTDMKLRLRLDAGLEPRDEFVGRLDRSHVDLIASHGQPSSKSRRPYTADVRKDSAGSGDNLATRSPPRVANSVPLYGAPEVKRKLRDPRTFFLP